MTPEDTGRLIALTLIVLGIAAAELALITLLMRLHKARRPAPFWTFMEEAWKRTARTVASTMETILGTILIAMCFLSALTPAGRRRQDAAEANIARKRAEERDAFIHRTTRPYRGGQW